MSRIHLLRLLLLPSMASGSIAATMSLLFLGYSGWQYIQENQFFYDYLFGTYGLRTFFWERPIYNAGAHNLLSGSFAYGILVAAVAVACGVICYVLLEAIRSALNKEAELANDLRVAGPVKEDMTDDIVTRICLRIMALLGWGMYAAFFASTILEFTVVLVQLGIDMVKAGDLLGGLGQCALVLGGLFVAVHMHVIFLRLSLLRPRVLYKE